ncbi:hypothetical protein C6990_07835 [Nitrosopumilus sp. b3]|uniref:hypothetical protein n=1 Tax=Nitrosopumilus sp. b3 TaxID=2109909 RepID=UPI0015F40D60|nr:hypothetical protein [Nitrosopumilus sp. b3]KAF6246982.1 hypothetical protein C6990_07835 [Nitrosopumilus sp. b3]
MRIDSCRKCGIELEKNKKCDVCRKVNQFFCHRCGFTTDEQIHTECSIQRTNYSIQNAAVV